MHEHEKPASLRAERGGEAETAPTRVILADDHASFRAALRSVLASLPGVLLVGEATTAHEAIDLIRREQPHVALLDIRIPGLTIDQLATHSWAVSPGSALVLVAMHAEAPEDDTLPPGIAALVAKETAAADLPAALVAVALGGTFVSPSLERATRSQAPPDPGAAPSRARPESP